MTFTEKNANVNGGRFTVSIYSYQKGDNTVYLVRLVENDNGVSYMRKFTAFGNLKSAMNAFNRYKSIARGL